VSNSHGNTNGAKSRAIKTSDKPVDTVSDCPSMKSSLSMSGIEQGVRRQNTTIHGMVSVAA